MANRTPDVTEKLMEQALQQGYSGLRIKCISLFSVCCSGFFKIS